MVTKKKKSQKSAPFTSPLTSNHVASQEQSQNDNLNIENIDEENASDEETKHRQKRRKDNHIVKINESKKAKLEAEAKEEKRLTSLLFGGFGGTGGDEDGDGNGDNFSGGEENIEDDGDGNDAIGGGGSAWKDDDEEEENNGELFKIDRSGVDDEENNDNQKEEEDDDDEQGSNDDDDSEDNNEQDSNQDNEETSDEDGEDDDDEEEDQMNSAWVDEDDDNIAISLQMKSDRVKKLRKTMSDDVVYGKDYESRLRERFQSTSSAIARTDWANVDKEQVTEEPDGGDDTDDDEEEGISSATKLLSSTTSLLASATSRLQPHILNVVRCPDANQKNYNQSTVQAVQFHPSSDEDEPLMMTAGLDKTLRFFKIGEGGENSQKIHGINFPNLPIYSASFLGDTGSVVVSGRRPFFYIYDAAAGKIDKIPRINGRKEKSLEKFTVSPDGSLIAFIGNDGYVIIVEAKSKMWVADLKMNGSARAVSFTPDGRYLVSSGSDGDVYRWDLRTKKCVDKYRNEDGTISSYLSASSKFLAVGAESGVVNIYKDGNSFLSSKRFTKRDPVKSIMNLHTSVDYMKFNPDGQILAMSSRREKDSLKLLHVPTQTVFSNWPTTKTPLSYVWSMDFSPASKYMAIGNDKGKCLLYKLSHYHDDM